jgi:hypothetical protein
MPPRKRLEHNAIQVPSVDELCQPRRTTPAGSSNEDEVSMVTRKIEITPPPETPKSGLYRHTKATHFFQNTSSFPSFNHYKRVLITQYSQP